MTRELQKSPGFWRTVWQLLGAAKKRARGRRARQQELLQNRRGNLATNWGGLGFVLAVAFMAVLNGGAAYVVSVAVDAGERIEAERSGKIVVSRSFLDAVQGAGERFPGTRDAWFPASFYSSEATELSERYGGNKEEIAGKLRTAVVEHGTEDLITRREAEPGLRALPTGGHIPALLGSIMLMWWAVMLVFQGEGLELDLQRRRHPMWEWLYSHPVPSGAIFFAEMLSPIAANPIYWSGPLFAGILYGLVYDATTGLLAAGLVGVPVTVAAACLGKALEIGVTLRFGPRTRGAMIGLMSWLGYASTMLFLLSLVVLPKIITVMSKVVVFFAGAPWPWLGWFLGQTDWGFSFFRGVINCWIFAGVTTVGAVWFSVWGAQQGLSGNFATAEAKPAAPSRGRARFGKDPLYRKEFLWFIRDRSALVQTILIPLTVASVQIFNLRGILSHAQGAWNYLCGVGILFGTYFLWVLGPKSLSSEGSALWIAMTWPRGLESLLKAKARLWSMISTGIVGLVLVYAAISYPAESGKIALVGIGWFIFGRSMAEKSVTLATVTSSSGEAEKIPWGRRGAAQLGMLTFCIGILTQQWHVAIMGIVYSYMTAAAMWQNFRARLPYLYDPWSEELPPAPTLMHAMIVISILVEGGAVVTGILVAAMGRENIAMAQALSYGICAVIVSLGTANFLNGRGVTAREVWRWEVAPLEETKQWWRLDAARGSKLLRLLLLGAGGGLLLGIFAIGYVAVLRHIPAIAEMIRQSEVEAAKIPDLKLWYTVMAVAFAPFAEEYIFRGLLYRALDREWGGWRAVVGSAAFFAIYHGPLAWLPVGLLGAANAVMFKKTGRLAPAVVLHMVYNAVVSMR
jgi:membrane protease YdiL (CAAX protease family)